MFVCLSRYTGQLIAYAMGEAIRGSNTDRGKRIFHLHTGSGAHPASQNERGKQQQCEVDVTSIWHRD